MPVSPSRRGWGGGWVVTWGRSVAGQNTGSRGSLSSRPFLAGRAPADNQAQALRWLGPPPPAITVLHLDSETTPPQPRISFPWAPGSDCAAERTAPSGRTPPEDVSAAPQPAIARRPSQKAGPEICLVWGWSRDSESPEGGPGFRHSQHSPFPWFWGFLVCRKGLTPSPCS